MKKLILLLLIPFYAFSQSTNVDGALKTLTASGTNNYVISETLPLSYDPHERFIVIFTNANTGASTLKRGTLAALPLQLPGGVDLNSGIIKAGDRRLVSCTGTYYQIISGINFSTFNNAIANNSGTVQLGGPLIQNTALNGQFNFQMGNTTPLTTFQVITGNSGATEYSYINSAQTLLQLRHIDPSLNVTSELALDATGSTLIGRNSSSSVWTSIKTGLNSSGSLVVTDNRSGGNKTGLQEASDYSSGYTSLSYTNKNYADTHLTGLTFTNSPTSGYIPQYNGTNFTWVATSIADGSVTLAKLANLPANTVIGNNTGSSATPLALTTSQLTAMVNNFTSSFSGAVPASGGGTTNFMRADGSWASPITTSTYSPTANGITNINSVTPGNFWYQTDGTFYHLYGQFQVSTAGSGNATFDFDFPAGVTWSNSDQVVGMVSGINTFTSTGAISGIVFSSLGSTQVRCTFTSTASILNYKIYVNVFYHP